MSITIIMANTVTSAVVPTDVALRDLCAREHPACFACRPVAQGGLGLAFSVQPDGRVAADWDCPQSSESYTGIVHGGLLATALDSAMVHALFARGVVARTGELTIRYRQPVQVGLDCTVTAWLRASYPPLYHLEAEVSQAGATCAAAHAKFMAGQCSPMAVDDSSCVGRESFQ